MVDDDRTCLYYKLTYEPKGSGELKISSVSCHYLLQMFLCHPLVKDVLQLSRFCAHDGSEQNFYGS